MFSNPGSQAKMGRAISIFCFLDFDWTPLKTWYFLWYLSEEKSFYIILKLKAPWVRPVPQIQSKAYL